MAQASSHTSPSHEVYLVESQGAPRNHHALFVETPESGAKSGHIFQVTGNIQQGMTFERKTAEEPELSLTFISKSHLGSVRTVDFSRISEVCRNIPPPKKQFDGPKRLYPTEPLRRCQEWTSEAIQALNDAHMLQ